MILQPFLCAANWGVVGWVLVGTVVLIIVLAAVGRGIAAAFPPNPEHVSTFRRPVAAAVPAAPAPAPAAPAAAPAAPVSGASAISPEIMAVIAASVAVVLRGKNFSITGVAPAAPKAPDIEQLMSLWSLEGRRQVYSSHSLQR